MNFSVIYWRTRNGRVKTKNKNIYTRYIRTFIIIYRDRKSYRNEHVHPINSGPTAVVYHFFCFVIRRYNRVTHNPQRRPVGGKTIYIIELYPRAYRTDKSIPDGDTDIIVSVMRPFECIKYLLRANECYHCRDNVYNFTGSAAAAAAWREVSPPPEPVADCRPPRLPLCRQISP